MPEIKFQNKSWTILTIVANMIEDAMARQRVTDTCGRLTPCNTWADRVL